MERAKPVLFLSHATTDAAFANVLKAEIDRVFANGVDVFVSSLPGAIAAGRDWLASVEENLDTAAVAVVLVTPVSINRPWVWFEVGASWSKMREGKRRIFPLCAPEIDLGDLPEPLNRLQALSLGKAEHVKEFFRTLCDEFGFGNMKGFRGSAITSRLPKYSEVKVDGRDLAAGTLYRGPYEGYGDDELAEVLDERYLYPAHWAQQDTETRALLEISDGGERKRDASIFSGKLIDYREVNEELELPPGTSKRLLKEVAARYGLQPEREWENSVRFRHEGDDSGD